MTFVIQWNNNIFLMNNIINNNIIYYIFNVFLKINYFLQYLYIKKIIDEGSDIFISTPCSVIWPCSSLYTAIKWLITNRYLARRLNNLKFTKNSSLTQKTETIENEFTLLYYLIGYWSTSQAYISPVHLSYSTILHCVLQTTSMHLNDYC